MPKKKPLPVADAELLAALPDPQAIRDRLADIAREARLLRRLLRLSIDSRQAPDRREAARA